MKTIRINMRPILFRSVVPLALVIIVIAGFFAFFSTQPKTARADNGSSPVIGVWFINAVGAPFQPHIATFQHDGTMIIDNPESGDPHTSDSAGMGPWQIVNGNISRVRGKFEEINADRTTNAYVSYLIVTFTITISGNTFTGPANATYFNPDGTLQQGPFPATLNGTRLTLP